jgi:hypothetical protein
VSEPAACRRFIITLRARDAKAASQAYADCPDDASGSVAQLTARPRGYWSGGYGRPWTLLARSAETRRVLSVRPRGFPGEPQTLKVETRVQIPLDYRREAPGQGTSHEATGSLNDDSIAEYPENIPSQIVHSRA